MSRLFPQDHLLAHFLYDSHLVDQASALYEEEREEEREEDEDNLPPFKGD